MRATLVKIFVTIFLIGMTIWLLLILGTVILPKGNPLGNIVTSVLGLPSDFVAKPKSITEVNTPEDFLYSDAFYRLTSVSTFIVLTGVFTLARGRNILEKFLLLQAYALPRERDYWGKIMDADTYVPVPFATVRLFRIEDGREIFIVQTVTDIDGRYRLYIAEKDGEYYIEVQSPGYLPYKQKIRARLIEGKYAVRMNIILQREHASSIANPVGRFFFRNKSRILGAITVYVFCWSIVVSTTALYTLIVYTNFVSVGNFIFYAWSGPWNIFVLLERRKFNPGRILNYKTGKPIAGATLQLLLSSGTTLSILSDENGITKIDGEPGYYMAKVFKPGFALKENVLGESQIYVTNEGFLKNDIYLMPFAKELPNQGLDLLFQNPFGGGKEA